MNGSPPQPIRLRFGRGQGDRWRPHRIAGEPVWTDVTVPELAAFRVDDVQDGAGDAAAAVAGADVRRPPRRPMEPGDPSDESNTGQPLYSGPGWVGGAVREVTSLGTPRGYSVVIDGVGHLHVITDGRSGTDVVLENVQASVTRGQVVETLLGPGLILALAMRQTWCLHASAVMRDGRAMAVVGDSGTGKSTLAAFLDGRAGWKRIGDDILPVTWTGQRLLAWPHFPQLKCDPADQPGRRAPQSVPLERIVFLRRGQRYAAPGSVPMTATDAVVVLIHCTVSARLFASEASARTLRMWSDVERTLGVQLLGVPDDLDRLSEVASVIEEHSERGE